MVTQWPRAQVQGYYCALTDKYGKEASQGLKDLPKVTNPGRPQDMAASMKSQERRVPREVCCAIWGLELLLCTLNVSLSAGSLPSVYKQAHRSKTRKVKNTLLLALTLASGYSAHLLLFLSPPPFRKWTQDPLLGNMPATLSHQICTPPPCTCGVLHPTTASLVWRALLCCFSIYSNPVHPSRFT